MSRADLTAILLYTSLYILSISLLLFLNIESLQTVLPFSLPLLALNILVYFLTKGYTPGDYDLRNKVYAVPLFIISLILYYSINIPEFGGVWPLNSVISKLLFLFALPAAYFLIVEKGYISYLFRMKNPKKELKVALLTALLIIIPTIFYNQKSILSGGVTLSNLIVAFPVALIYYFFHAALPEEFCFRAFLQENMAQISKSRVFGLVSQALIFGLLHVSGIIGWYHIGVYEALARAILIQSALGLVFGYIWEKTRSLASPIILHALIDAVSNINLIARRIYGF